jgi:hypothetical protein
MNEYSQGICEDGAAILLNGKPMKIEEILKSLRQRDELLDAMKGVYGYLSMGVTPSMKEVKIVIAKCEAES